MGNYSFTNHVEVPAGTPLGIDVPTVLQELRSEFPGVRLLHEPGCAVRADHESADDAARGIAAAVRAARSAEVAVVVVGDRAGLFGRGTVGEGSDTDDLRLAGRQPDLIDAVLDTGTPTVLVLVTGRPYPLERWASRAAAVVQAFFPGEEGASAIAGGPQRAGEPERTAAGEHASQGGWAAVLLPPPSSGRGERHLEHRPRSAVPVRARPVVHPVRALRASPSPPRRGTPGRR